MSIDEPITVPVTPDANLVIKFASNYVRIITVLSIHAKQMITKPYHYSLLTPPPHFLGLISWKAPHCSACAFLW